MDYKVSIIVPIYNGERYIGRAIESLINQTYSNIEIIAVNDGSKDNSLKMLKKYESKDTRIKVIDKINTGVSDTRNKGLEEATGDLIGFLDMDDFLEPTMIEKMVYKLIEEKVDVIRCDYIRETTRGKQLKKNDISIQEDKIVGTENIQETVLKKVLDGNLESYIWLLLINKTKVKKIPKFRTDIVMMEDKVFYVELLNQINSIYFLKEKLYHYIWEENLGSRKIENAVKSFDSICRVKEEIEDILKEKKIADKDNIVKLNTKQSMALEEIIYQLYCNNKDRENLKVIYKELFEDKRVKEIIKKSDFTKIPLRYRIAIKQINEEQLDKIIRYYKTKRVLSKIKRICKR